VSPTALGNRTIPIRQVSELLKTGVQCAWNGTAVGPADIGRAFVNHESGMGFPAMTSFHQLGILAASRGEGLHPKLQALLARTAASPFSEVSMRRDGMIQAGPSPSSEVAPSGINATLFTRESTRRVVAAPKPQTQTLSTETPKRDRIA
jgi:hypothetical protein